jgi:hypothetical protein
MTNTISQPILALDAAAIVPVTGVASATSAAASGSSGRVTTPVYAGGSSYSSPTPASANGDTDNGGNSGTATKVRTSVGVGVGALLIAALVVYLLLWR